MGGTKKYDTNYFRSLDEQKNGGGAENEDECETLTFTCPIHNTNDSLKLIVVGDVLTISRASDGTIKVLNNEGNIGNLIAPMTTTLAYCIIKKYNYKALVVRKEGLRCDVKVIIDN